MIEATSKRDRAGSRPIFTIGYEGVPLGEFVRRLRDVDVEVLVDVRELPLSRKRGFSKSPLAAALKRADIEYLHVRALGAPKEIRRRAYETGDVETFFEEYRSHLRLQLPAIREIAALARSRNTCLLCFEEDPQRCHRSAVARSVRAAMAGRIRHL